MDAFDDDGLEVAIAVRTKHHVLVHFDFTFQHGSAKYQAYALAEVSRVYDELRVHMEDLLRILEHSLILLVSAIDHLRNLSLLGARVLPDDRHRQFREEASQQLDAFASTRGDGKYWADTTCADRSLHLLDVLIRFHDNGHSVGVLLHDPRDLRHVVVEDFFRSKVDLSENDEERQLQSARNAEMLLRHFRNAPVRGDDQQAVVREQRSQAVHGRLQVLLVATHVEQVNNLSGVLDDVRPNFVTLIGVCQLGDILLAVLVEANDLMRNAGGSTVAPLVLESENPLTQQAVAVVECAWG